MWKALTKFSAPMQDIEQEDFTDTNLVYQIGIAPNRIDIIMGVAGLSFAEAWKNKVTSTYESNPVNILSLQDLIIAKKASGRPQDLIDAKNLDFVLKQSQDF